MATTPKLDKSARYQTALLDGAWVVVNQRDRSIIRSRFWVGEEGKRLARLKRDTLNKLTMEIKAEMDNPNIPVCHSRPMIPVISYRTSGSAYDRKQDTPVYWCADCGRKIKRELDEDDKRLAR